jgi:GNAT superfamily N-acetyltransferase
MSTTEARTRAVKIEELTAHQPGSLIKAARELLLEYGRFVLRQPGAARFCFDALEKEAASLPHSFHHQGGGCLLAHANNLPVGFVAWRTGPVSVSAHAWELKRLWVRPAGRGLGLGRALTQAVLDRAVAANRKAVCLDTVPGVMAAAHHVYLELGFSPCEAYNDSPIDGISFLVKYI